MPVDFPNTPSVGDTFLAGGILRRWDGITWSIVPQTIAGPAGSSGVISVTAPLLNTGTSTSAALAIDQPNLISGRIYSGGVSSGNPTRIFVQATQPSSGMSAGDLWFWGT